MQSYSLRRARPLKLFLPLLTIALCACESASKVQPVVTVVDNSCAAFRQLSWSVQDTRETSTQVRQHNARYAALCPKPASEVATR
jgi:hypothetical protein